MPSGSREPCSPIILITLILYKVQLQLLGAIATANRRGEAPFLRAQHLLGGNVDKEFFEVTGHNLSGKLLDYWRSTGGLPVYGYPISEPFTEKSNSDGKNYTVQYFERNRLELHPEAAGTPFEVQLGLLGSELLDAQGGPAAFANLGQPHSYPPANGGGGNPTPGAYPKQGHAPDYSWIAGKVQFTRIQGGCVYIRAGDIVRAQWRKLEHGNRPGRRRRRCLRSHRRTGRALRESAPAVALT